MRKSPSASATLYDVGKVKIGNDGNKWIIVETKNGIKRWKLFKKISESKKSEKVKKYKKYKIHFNG